VIMTGCNGWEDGLDVMIEGAVMQVTEHSVLERLTKAWLKKWDGRWKYDVLNGREELVSPSAGRCELGGNSSAHAQASKAGMCVDRIYRSKDMAFPRKRLGSDH
jgi:hypothetical protein